MEPHQRQAQRQKDHWQPPQENHARHVVVDAPDKLVGKNVPVNVRRLHLGPAGMVEGVDQVGQQQHRQAAQAVDQRGMLQAQARIAGLNKRRSTRQVILLIHRRAVVHQAVQRQEKKEPHRQHHQTQSPLLLRQNCHRRLIICARPPKWQRPGILSNGNRVTKQIK